MYDSVNRIKLDQSSEAKARNWRIFVIASRMENQHSWLLRRWIDLRESSTPFDAVDESEFVFRCGGQR